MMRFDGMNSDGSRFVEFISPPEEQAYQDGQLVTKEMSRQKYLSHNPQLKIALDRLDHVYARMTDLKHIKNRDQRWRAAVKRVTGAAVTTTLGNMS